MADIALRIKSDMEQAQKDFRDLERVSDDTRKKIEKFSESFKTEQIDKMINKNKLAGVAMTATRGKTEGLKTEYYGLRREIEGLIKRGMNPQDESLKKLTKRYAQLDRELGGVQGKAKSTALSFGTLTKSIIGANLIERGLFAIGRGFKGIYDEAVKLEDATAAFTPLMGSTEKATALVKEMNIAAAKTPFQFGAIQKSVSQLLPVMEGDIKKTVDTFKMLGDTAGGNAQKLESITRGFTKAMLKGKVDMESLNMIAEAGVPIFTEMAQTMGYGKDNMQAFFKQISTGTVSTDELVEAFQKMTSEGGIFFEGMIIASKTTSGVMSTLRDNIAMTAAGIGQAFLPYIKAVAITIINVSSAILEWVSTGDNLKNMLSTLGYVLSGVTAGIIAYNIASKASVIASFSFVGAIKALTAAALANPFTAIATVITAVLVPAIIWMVKNFDLVKYKVLDFALAAREKMLQLSIAIREKVIGAVLALVDKLAQLPLIGKAFKKIADSEREITARMKEGLAQTQRARSANEKRYKESQEQHKKRIENAKSEAKAIKEANDKIIQSDGSKMEALKANLEKIRISEQASQRQRIEYAQEFFSKRAEIEASNFDSRLEWLQERLATVNEIEGLNREQKLEAEKGLRKAIEEEERKLLQARLQFGGDTISTASSMLSDLQTVFKNAGKESYELAVGMKALAAAQAMVNTLLAYTQVLAQQGIPFPFKMIAAGITLAAGLAKQAAILSTPIPKAQTGLTDYTVPETSGGRNDRAAVMASPGEQVSVTPRGESAMRTNQFNIMIEEEPIFRVVQRGIDTGKIDVSDRNVGRTVFST